MKLFLSLLRVMNRTCPLIQHLYSRSSLLLRKEEYFASLLEMETYFEEGKSASQPLQGCPDTFLPIADKYFQPVFGILKKNELLHLF